MTGPSTYKYFKVNDTEFNIDHSQLNNVDRSQPVADSTNFTCHAWMSDTARIVICSERGDIILCENSGEFYAFVEQVKQGVKCIVPFTRGFVVGWSTGLFTCYERYDDPQTTQSYYRRFKEISTFLEQPY